MTEHEPECSINIGSIEVVIDGKPATTVQYCGCSMLRLCERRVREDERSNNFTPDDHADGMTEAYHRGLDAAREAVEKMDLHGCFPHQGPIGCNCIGPQIIAAIDALRKESNE